MRSASTGSLHSNNAGSDKDLKKKLKDLAERESQKDVMIE
jgi:hypothetical protein